MQKYFVFFLYELINRISSELIVYIILSGIPEEKHQQLANKETKHTKITWAKLMEEIKDQQNPL